MIHTGDLHLGAEYKSFHEKSGELQEEAYNAFKKLIHYTIDPYNEIDILIIAGDLFDNPKPDFPLVEKVKELLIKVTSKDIKVYLLPGNHDSYSYKNSIYRTFEFPGVLVKNSGFTCIDEINIKGQDVFIYSGLYELNNPNKRILKDFQITERSGTHIGILHGSLELREINIPDRELPFSYEEFTYSKLNYLALGHYHSYKEKSKNKDYKCAYSGSLVPRTIDEYGLKYSLCVEIQQDNTVIIEKFSFSKIRVEKRIINMMKEDISNIDDLINLLKRGKDIYLILDLYLEDVVDFAIDEKRLIEVLQDHYFYIRINNEVKFIKSSLVNQLSEEETIRGLFFRKLLKKSKLITKDKNKILDQALNLGLRDFTDTGRYKDAEFEFQKGNHSIEID